jgi:RNA polymerase sigma-70 factor (ECF subfamily)
VTTEVSSSRWQTRIDGLAPEGDPSVQARDTIPRSDWSDIDLVEAVVAGCGGAYSEIYRRHSKSVLAAAHMILGNAEECEDVVADVFMGLWLAPEKFDPARGTLLGFLRLKSKARSLDVLRSVTSRRRRERSERDMGRNLVEDVDSALLASESASALKSALSLLPSAEQDPIYLAFFVGMPYANVADQLQLPEGTVKSRIRSGLLRLRMSGDLREYVAGGPRHEEGGMRSPRAARNALDASGNP